MLFLSKVFKKEFATFYLYDTTDQEIQERFKHISQVVVNYLKKEADTAILGEYYISHIKLSDTFQFLGFKPKKMASLSRTNPLDIFGKEGEDCVFHYYIDGIRFLSFGVQYSIPKEVTYARVQIEPPYGLIGIDLLVCEKLLTKKFHKPFDGKAFVSHIRSQI